MAPAAPKCRKLTEITEAAAKELGLPTNSRRSRTFERIADFGVMFTPALVVDGQVQIAGKVPSVEDVKKLLA